MLKIHQSTKETDGYSNYKFSDIDIQLEAHDTDITLTMPNGYMIQLQFRVESPSLDICLPQNEAVTNWIGDDMEAAPVAASARGAGDHIRLAKQIMIGLPPECLSPAMPEN